MIHSLCAEFSAKKTVALSYCQVPKSAHESSTQYHWAECAEA